MSTNTSMSRKDQAARRKAVYQFFKQIEKEKAPKEQIYQRVASKFNYLNVTSVKAVIRQLKIEEVKQNQINLNIAKGILDTVLVAQEIFLDFNPVQIGFKYKLQNSEIEDNVFVSATFNTKTGATAECFDHFSVTDVKSAFSRISNLLQECKESYS